MKSVHVFDDEAHEHDWEFDSVVLVTQRRSDEALFRSLKDDIGVETLKTEGVDSLYRIGDCEAPRLIADAVFSGPPAGTGDRFGQPGSRAAVQARAKGHRAGAGERLTDHSAWGESAAFAPRAF